MNFLSRSLSSSLLIRRIIKSVLYNCVILSRIKILPPLVFENLNSLETLSLQNNKLVHIPEEVTENIVDTLRHIDITGNMSFRLFSYTCIAFSDTMYDKCEIPLTFSIRTDSLVINSLASKYTRMKCTSKITGLSSLRKNLIRNDGRPADT